MKQLTLLLALFAFLAVGCQRETEIEVPSGEIEYEEETDLDAEMDQFGTEFEQGAQEVEGALDETAEDVEQELDAEGR